ncbi:MAG: RHS repeat protein [Planctomycetes bacterium]|nr:RHS repeat protein [Planctomycetota bacterium]
MRTRTRSRGSMAIILIPLWLGPASPVFGEETFFKRGDSNSDGTLDISDPIHSLEFLYIGKPGPTCMDAADANDDGGLDQSDAIYSLEFKFLGGPPPPPPFLECGADLTSDDELGCGSFAPCQPPVEPPLPTFSEAEARGSGPGHPWQGGPWLGALNAWLLRDLVNLASLSLQARAFLVALRTPSGLTVPVSLYHNSQAAYSNPVLPKKWNHSLWVFLLPYVEQDNIQRMGLYWGNHTEQRFKLQGGQWTPLDGYRDGLQTTPTGATLTLHDQTRLEFFAGYLAGKRAYLLDRIVDTSGQAIDLDYDMSGRVASATDPAGRTLALTYNPDGRLAQVTFAYGAFSRSWEMRYENDTLAQIVYPPVTTDAGPQVYTASFAYDPRGNIVKTTDRERNEWLYGYDFTPVPDRLRWVQPPGNTPAQRFEYKWLDPVTREFVDPVGATSRITYDAFNRVVSWSQVTTTQGFTWALQYTDGDYPWAPSIVRAPSGTSWQYDYDPAGNPIGAIDPAGNRWDYTYDAFNNLVQVLQPLIRDVWGNTEPGRRRMDLDYDSNHRLILRRRLARFASPLNESHEWSYLYNPFGQVTHATDPLGRTTVYTYDPLGNLIEVRSPEGRTFEWKHFDPEGTFGFTLPDAVVNGLGQLTKLARDEWGRLRMKDYPASPDEKYSYDGLSRLVRAEDAFTPPTVYTYYASGPLLAQERGPQRLQIARLPNGRRASVVESGVPLPRNLQYQYDQRNLLKTLIDGGAQIGFAYDEDGRLIQRTLPNGVSAEYAYNFGKLTSIGHRQPGGPLFAVFDYGYQANGQRMQVVEMGGAATVRYGYDLLDRLAREERSGAVPYEFRWIYDAAGHRLSQLQDGLLTEYSHDQDGLLTQMTGPPGARTYAWDAAGRLVQRTFSRITETFAYDDAGRLIHADQVQQGMLPLPWRDYLYNALGRRILRLAFAALGQPESQTAFSDAAGAPFREERISLQGGGQTSFRPTFAGGLVRWLDVNTGQCMYPATDADGSIRAWTDNSGAVGPYAAVYNAFGQAILDQGPRPPYAFAADSGARNDGDFGWLALPGGGFYSPVEQILVGQAVGGHNPQRGIPWEPGLPQLSGLLSIATGGTGFSWGSATQDEDPADRALREMEEAAAGARLGEFHFHYQVPRSSFGHFCACHLVGGGGCSSCLAEVEKEYEEWNDPKRNPCPKCPPPPPPPVIRIYPELWARGESI